MVRYARHASGSPEAEGKPMVTVSDDARRTLMTAGAARGGRGISVYGSVRSCLTASL
jgi:hypothetical protein